MANFSSSSVGSGMGTFRGMMWCFISDWPSTLSMLPILTTAARYPQLKSRNPSLSFTDPKNFTNGWIQIIHFPKPRWKADSAEGSFYCPKMPFTHAFKVYSELHCSSPPKPTFKSNNKKTAAFSSIKSFCSLPDQSIPHHRFPPATDSTHIPSTAFF